MSRILWVDKDDREIPWDVCWWRLPLQPNADGYYAIYQIYAPFPPWAGHLDCFDGRNDWSWPFKAHLTEIPPVNELDSIYQIIYPTRQYLDVLDTVPPDVSPESRWFQLTPTERRHRRCRELCL